VKEAIAKFRKPEIMITYRWSQFTGSAWITTLIEADIKISMDGRGRYLDNIFIERPLTALDEGSPDDAFFTTERTQNTA
jgi:putative transposase